MTDRSPGRPWPAYARVALVAGIGVVAGLVLLVVAPQALPPAPAPCAPGVVCSSSPAPAPPSGFFTYPHVAGLLIAVALAALVALLVVYVETYRATRSPQILGLLVFLAALGFETVVTSPLVFARVGPVPAGLRPFLLAGQLLECAALLLFLYLALQ